MSPAIHDLASFAAEVRRLAAVVDAPANLLPTFGRSEDFARPHIEFDGTRFHFVVVERGQEYERISSTDPDPILYEAFQSVTFSMATSYELRHRRPGEDFRRQMFDVQLDLLARLSSAWARRRREAIEATLGNHPFTDA